MGIGNGPEYDVDDEVSEALRVNAEKKAELESVLRELFFIASHWGVQGDDDARRVNDLTSQLAERILER